MCLASNKHYIQFQSDCPSMFKMLMQYRVTESHHSRGHPTGVGDTPLGHTSWHTILVKTSFKNNVHTKNLINSYKCIYSHCSCLLSNKINLAQAFTGPVLLLKIFTFLQVTPKMFCVTLHLQSEGTAL